MKVWRLGVVLLLAGMAAACGGNSTAVGVTVTAPGVTRCNRHGDYKRNAAVCGNRDRRFRDNRFLANLPARG